MRKKIIVAVITALLITGIYGIAKAESLDNLQEKRQELQKQIEEASTQIEDIEINLTDALEEISTIDAQIYEQEEKVKEITTELETIENEIKTAEEKLEVIEEKYEIQKKAFEERLVFLYEQGDTTYLDVLVNSRDITEFISNYYLIAELAEYDADLLDTIEREKNNISYIEEQLNTKKEQLKELKKSQEKATITLENKKIVRKSYANKLTKEEKELQEKIEEYGQEINNIDTIISVYVQNNISEDYVGGLFDWPLPGYYGITSNFGMRFHPILKDYRTHTGMDVGAPTGTYVIAANDGVVTTATYSASYGNMVVIDHGGGVSTLYAHASELLVTMGDTVKRGDAIMKVGSTGWSTGPHLHFGVIINGVYVDPYPYVTTNNEESNN